MSDDDKRKYWTPKQIGEHLAVKTSRVIEYIKTGEMTGVLVSISTASHKPQYRVRGEEFDRFIDARTVRPPRRRRRRRQIKQYV